MDKLNTLNANHTGIFCIPFFYFFIVVFFYCLYIITFFSIIIIVVLFTCFVLTILDFDWQKHAHLRTRQK